MRCPYCHQNIRVQGKFCPKCGEQIFGLPVPQHEAQPPVTPPPIIPPPPAPWIPPPDLAEVDYEDFPPMPGEEPVLEIELEDSEVAVEKPSGEVVGKICPYCRFPIKAGEPVQICPHCAVPHHRECWMENGGCTTYGCRSSPQVAGTIPVAAPSQPQYPGPLPPTALPHQARALLEQELDRMATNALVYAILGVFCFILALVGLLTGISVLSQITRSGCAAPGARAKAWAAVVISALLLIGPLLLIGISMAAGG